MEELRSTEKLDLEILEDARKKAYRILKTADAALDTQSREWEKKTHEAMDSIKKTYAERTKKTGEEIFARLPLDKRRFRSEIAEGFLIKAMDDFLRSLEREKLLSVLEIELSRRLEISPGEWGGAEGTKPELLYSGMTLSEVRKLLRKVLKSSAKSGGRSGDWDIKEGGRVHEFPFVIINTRTLKITASVETAAGALLKDKRAELAAALLGEGVLND